MMATSSFGLVLIQIFQKKLTIIDVFLEAVKAAIESCFYKLVHTFHLTPENVHVRSRVICLVSQ